MNKFHRMIIEFKCQVLTCPVPDICCFITAEKGGVARAKGEGEKEKECTTEGEPTTFCMSPCTLFSLNFSGSSSDHLKKVCTSNL